ncbi:MAG: hypothetical protein R3263_12595, partial [Myxococcota bacterium]|nr:hypothetical protein [Myxococcota bacterium]
MSDPAEPPGAPSASALDLLRRPRRFFAARAEAPVDWMTPFTVVAATVLLGALVEAVVLVSGRAGPQGAQALELLGDVD